MPKAKKNVGGRPPAVSEKVKLRIEEGFTKGFNKTQVALYADISSSTLYKYLSENPDFAERCKDLSEHVLLLARQNIYEKLAEGDDYTSRWMLEKKDKGFTDKIEHTFNGPTRIEIVAGDGDT